jgi:cathepsin D
MDHPFVDQGYWLAPFNSISVNGQTIVGSTAVIFDTGSTMIVGDPTGIENLFKPIIGAKWAPQVGRGLYTSGLSSAATWQSTYLPSILVPCNFNTPISFDVGGKTISISPASFNLGPIFPGSDTCVAGAASEPNLTGG